MYDGGRVVTTVIREVVTTQLFCIIQVHKLHQRHIDVNIPEVKLPELLKMVNKFSSSDQLEVCKY